MKKIVKKIASLFVVCGLLASMAVTSVSAREENWNVYQYKGAPTSAYKVTDKQSWTSQSNETLIMCKKFNISSGYLLAKSSNGINNYISGPYYVHITGGRPGVYVTMSVTLCSGSCLTQTASGYFRN